MQLMWSSSFFSNIVIALHFLILFGPVDCKKFSNVTYPRAAKLATNCSTSYDCFCGPPLKYYDEPCTKQHKMQKLQNFSATPTEEIYKDFQRGSVFGLEKSDGTHCFLAKFIARLVIRKLGSVKLPRPKDQFDYIMEIPDSATKTGHCARQNNKNVDFQLIWATEKGDQYKLVFLFDAEKILNQIKDTFEWEWRLKQVNFQYESPTREPDESLQGEMVTSHSPVWAPMTQSFYCKHALNVTIRNVNNATTPVDITLQFKSAMQLQPYEVPNGGGFGNTFLCERSRQISLLERLRSNTTIGAGCVLAIVTIGTIIGHAVKRQWYPNAGRQSYTTMQ